MEGGGGRIVVGGSEGACVAHAAASVGCLHCLHSGGGVSREVYDELPAALKLDSMVL